jgi:acetamidase/formamidase
VKGALFSIGDGHARQGERCGVAVECAMDTVVVVDLIKGVGCPWPLENDECVMSTGSARPLEDAFRIGHTDMVRWMGAEFGLSTMDAYQLVTQVSESPVANVCDPNYTFVCKVRKRWLPEQEVMSGIRRRLGGMGASYLGESRGR